MNSYGSASSYSGIPLSYTPAEALACTDVRPWEPFLVVMRITPLEARLPYRAAEAASFRTVIDSISVGFKSAILPPNGTPSITYSGLEEPFTVPLPRIMMDGLEPGLP